MDRRKALRTLAGTAGAGLLVPGAMASAAELAAPRAGQAPRAAGQAPTAGLRAGDVSAQSVLWSADPALGTAVFDGIEQAPGTISVAADPLGGYGQCFRYQITDNGNGKKERCESRGMRGPDGQRVELGDARVGQAFYFGWRSLWSPLPIAKGKWTALYQLHVSGLPSGGYNVGPFVLRTLGDGQLYFQHHSPNATARHIWSTPLSIGRWHSFAIGFRLSRGADGWVEFWYDGAPQTFSNGQTRYPGATLWGTHVNTKWGIYRSGGNNGTGSAYLNHARLGTSYADVAL